MGIHMWRADLRHGGGDADAALFLLADGDLWRLLVQTNAKALEFSLDDALVSERRKRVQDD